MMKTAMDNEFRAYFSEYWPNYYQRLFSKIGRLYDLSRMNVRRTNYNGVE